MSKNENKMHLPKVTLDDLFTDQKARDNQNKDYIEYVPIKDIDDFPNHPFKVRNDQKMIETVESVKENGVLVPAIVRIKEDGKYEMVAGHRRKRACELAKIDKIPCLVKDLTDDQATIIMVDSNLQREQILPSERAFAYKMKLEAMKRQGKRTDLTCDQNGYKLSGKKSVEILAEEVGESKTQVQRYIRLTELIPEILELVDNQILCDNDKQKMALLPAVEISYLKEDEQYTLLDTIECLQVTPSHAQAIVMRKRSEDGTLTADKIDEIMSQEKANQIPKIKLNEDRFLKVLPSNLKTAQEREDYIFHCVQETRKRELKQKEYAR